MKSIDFVLMRDFKEIIEIINNVDNKQKKYSESMFLVVSEIINKANSIHNKGFEKMDKIIKSFKEDFLSQWKQLEDLILKYENPKKIEIDLRRENRKFIHDDYKIDIADTKIEDEVWGIVDRKEKLETDEK